MKVQRQQQRIIEGNGDFYTYIERIFDGIMLSILWLLLSLPILTIGASTTALYYTTVKVIKKERGYLLEEFLNSFKVNFKDATILWITIVIVGFILQLNIGILFSLTHGYFGLFFICCYILFHIFILGVAAYAFAALSRLDMSIGWILKVSIYMTVRYLPITLILIAIIAGAIVLVYFIPFLIFFIPTGASILYSYFMEKILIRHSPKITR